MAVVTTAVVAGAGLAYGVYSGERARKDAKKAERKAEAANAKAEQELDDRKNIEKAENVRDNRRARQKIKSGNSQGRSSTILTGPNGAFGGTIGSSEGGKTLIGL